ncbi:hypothetical protein DFJ73DRAFT_779247 [Zopfochytrium polystomum]|nr:hypothetical protein DFJ73DRAFT_779247 [Zopfochytrium polystomum]
MTRCLPKIKSSRRVPARTPRRRIRSVPGLPGLCAVFALSEQQDRQLLLRPAELQRATPGAKVAAAPPPGRVAIVGTGGANAVPEPQQLQQRRQFRSGGQPVVARAAAAPPDAGTVTFLAYWPSPPNCCLDAPDESIKTNRGFCLDNTNGQLVDGNPVQSQRCSENDSGL